MESLGLTGDGRDIWMMKLDASDYFDNVGIEHNEVKKAVLMTGAHHARELVSVQMPLYVILDLLHALVQNGNDGGETIEILKRSQIWTIPFVNVDGSFTIWDHWQKNGELILKRKNNNR